MTVFTITPNPMLDKRIWVGELERGKVHRGNSMEIGAGGKGVNVARQLKKWGIETVAMGFLGGKTGEMVRNAMDREGLAHDFVWIQSSTREGLSFIEESGIETSVFEPSPKVSKQERHSLEEKINEKVKKGDWLVCAGSVPCKELNDFYAGLIQWGQEHEVNVFLDTYGEALKKGIAAKPKVMKINMDEFAMSFGFKLEVDTCAKGVRELNSRGAEYAILTQGARDTFAACKGQCWKIKPPEVEEVSNVGSGDVMTAGFLKKWFKTQDFEESLKWGVAAGAANAQTWNVARVDQKEVEALLDRVEIKKAR